MFQSYYTSVVLQLVPVFPHQPSFFFLLLTNQNMIRYKSRVFTWEVALGDFTDVEEEGRGSDQIHDHDSWKKHLQRQGEVQHRFYNIISYIYIHISHHIRFIQNPDPVWIKASVHTWTISEWKPPLSQTQWQAGMMPYAATEQKMAERSVFHSWVWYSGWIWAENTARIRARTVIRYTCLQNWGRGVGGQTGNESNSICLYNNSHH